MNNPKLTAKQKEGLKLLKSQFYNEILFDGGSRSGKTFLVLFYLCCLSLAYPGSRFLVARLRLAHVIANIWLQDLPKFKKYSLFGCMTLDNTNHIIRFGESEIWLAGLDDQDRVDKALGQEYAGIFLNEAVQIPKSSRDLIITRLAQNIDGLKNFIIYDCNPRHPGHYLYQEFYVQKDINRTKMKWLPEDNKENLPDGYINNILIKLSGNDYKRFGLGEWASVPGAVYENILDDHKIKVNQDFMYYDDVVAGLDFGLYTALSLWGVKNNRAYCMKEIILLGAKETVTKNIIKEIDEQIPNIKIFEVVIYCDHEPDRIFELANAGFIVKKAYKEVGPGDSSVNSFELFFDYGCENTFQSMLNLTHQEDGNGNFITGKHVKENDHEADGARYSLHGWKMDNGQGESHYFT